MAEKTRQDLKVTFQKFRACRLTKDQVFRLWKCAVKDDDRLVDAVIGNLYEQMIAFDLARAEIVMQLIIDRDETAAPTFRDLLRDIASDPLPTNGRSRPHVPFATQDFQAAGVPRELIRPIINMNESNDPDVNA
jgi:hypothetical protein